MKYSHLLFFFLLFTASLAVCSEKKGSISDDQELISAKIIGGTNASSSSWPWMTALLQTDVTDLFDAQYCGGALIAEQWVVTAGHCVWVYDGFGRPYRKKIPSEIEVAVGAHNLNYFSGDRVAVTHIITHPSFNPETLVSDIALLKLSKSSSQTPILLYSGESQEQLAIGLLGKQTTLIGWGRDDTEVNHYPTALQQVNLPIVSNYYCNNKYGTTLAASEICAGNFEGNGRDTCTGDSGGPMMVEIDDEWAHVGLVSWGASCSVKGAYGVYSRTSASLAFIQQYATGAKYTSSKQEPVPPVTPPLSAFSTFIPAIHLLLENK